MTDIFLGGQRPFGFGFWPLPEDDPGVDLTHETVRIVTDQRSAGTGGTLCCQPQRAVCAIR